MMMMMMMMMTMMMMTMMMMMFAACCLLVLLLLAAAGLPADDEPKFAWHQVHDTTLRAIFVPGEGGRVDHVAEVSVRTCVGVCVSE